MPRQPTAPIPPPLLAHELPLPPYAFVPGAFPHPVRDPAGHSFVAQMSWGAPPDELGWQLHEPYLHALDLFNRGYYWEAHEGFEHWWKLSQDPARQLFQGLLRLCAAGVKARQGLGAGVHSHGTKAAALLEAACADPTCPRLGLDLAALAAAAQRIALKAYTFTRREPMPTAEAALALTLCPRARP